MYYRRLSGFQQNSILCCNELCFSEWRDHSTIYMYIQCIVHVVKYNANIPKNKRTFPSWGNPDISTAPLPMWYTSMGYTPMRYISTALYFYTERTQVPSQFFLLTLQGKNVFMNILIMFYFFDVPLK